MIEWDRDQVLYPRETAMFSQLSQDASSIPSAKIFKDHPLTTLIPIMSKEIQHLLEVKPQMSSKIRCKSFINYLVNQLQMYHPKTTLMASLTLFTMNTNSCLLSKLSGSIKITP